jgi:thymidine kinase
MIQGGKIKLILGPMFSGKSTRLVETVRKYTYKNKKTVLVNFIDDKRYSENSQIVTHDLNKYDSLSCQMLGEIYDVIKNYDVIGIDEGQFYSDVVNISEKLAYNGKIVIIAALSGNFKMEPFETVSKLISKADKIKLMKAYCFYCQRTAGFSLRTVCSDQEILIGAGEAYRPVCKKCYYKYSNIKHDFLEDVVKEEINIFSSGKKEEKSNDKNEFLNSEGKTNKDSNSSSDSISL